MRVSQGGMSDRLGGEDTREGGADVGEREESKGGMSYRGGESWMKSS